MTDENILIIKAQQGDHESLNTLISKYWHPIYRFIYYKIGDGEEAQEVTQETFLRAFRSLKRYEITGASFKTYLGRIAINLLNDFWRKKGRSPVVIDIQEYQEPLVDTAAKPEEQAVSAELQRSILSLVDSLPKEQKQVVKLRIIDGRSVKEVSEMMGKSEAAVKMLQQRALKNLRSECIEQGIIP